MLRGKISNVARNPKYDAYQSGLGSLISKLFDKKFANTSAGAIKGGICQTNNYQIIYTNHLSET